MSNAQLENKLQSHLCHSFLDGKLPLFILGSGISYNKVPCLTEMVAWLSQKLKNTDAIDHGLRTTLLKQASALTDGRASRFDAAGFFSAFQLPGTEQSLTDLWQAFTKGLVAEGLMFNKKRYPGLLQLSSSDASSAHRAIAHLLLRGHCHIINLNYDPLLYLAAENPGITNLSTDRFISLYTPEDVRKYYSHAHFLSSDISSHALTHQSAVAHVRGDIFFSSCNNKECPHYGRSNTIEYSLYRQPKHVFICPTCHHDSNQLQLSFPGYETKEKLIGKMLTTLMTFIGRRISAMIFIGVSGQWDQYLLDEAFSRSVEFQIPIVDVRPVKAGEINNFELFRVRFYPSVDDRYRQYEPSCLRWYDDADTFMNWFTSAMQTVLTTPDHEAAEIPPLLK
jgi:transposase-like protein